MAVQVQLDLSGIEGAVKALEYASSAGADERFMDEMGAILLNRIRTRYLAETDPLGRKWFPSAAATARRAVGGTGTLYHTGNLFRSIQLARVGRATRRIFTDVEYGHFHQEGIGQWQRVFLGFSADDISTVELLVRKRMDDWAKEAQGLS